MSTFKPKRAAFFLNANAKSVTKTFLRKVTTFIAKEDLYLSTNFQEASVNMSAILHKGYAHVFCGGGDGTVIGAINLIYQHHKMHPHEALPNIGVLALGTGNAIARFLHAQKPLKDIKNIASGKSIKPIALSMIEAQGQLTPFAGIGYDGELINDFESVKEIFFDSPLRKLFASVPGFVLAGLMKTLPRQLGKDPPYLRINSSYPAYRILTHNGVVEEVFIEEGDLLYNDVASVVCVGTIPSIGYGITMFPFAHKRPGYMHLRISAVPLLTCLANIYPSIWHGHFRHHKLYDFLVKDVSIEAEESLPYHLGGDAMGYRKQLYFSIKKEPIMMASLNTYHTPIDMMKDPLLTLLT